MIVVFTTAVIAVTFPYPVHRRFPIGREEILFHMTRFVIVVGGKGVEGIHDFCRRRMSPSTVVGIRYAESVYYRSSAAVPVGGEGDILIVPVVSQNSSPTYQGRT